MFVLAMAQSVFIPEDYIAFLLQPKCSNIKLF